MHYDYEVRCPGSIGKVLVQSSKILIASYIHVVRIESTRTSSSDWRRGS